MKIEVVYLKENLTIGNTTTKIINKQVCPKAEVFDLGNRLLIRVPHFLDLEIPIGAVASLKGTHEEAPKKKVGRPKKKLPDLDV